MFRKGHHERPDYLARQYPKRQILCVTDVYEQIEGGGMSSKRTLLDKGGPKSQFLVGRF